MDGEATKRRARTQALFCLAAGPPDVVRLVGGFVFGTPSEDEFTTVLASRASTWKKRDFADASIEEALPADRDVLRERTWDLFQPNEGVQRALMGGDRSGTPRTNAAPSRFFRETRRKWQARERHLHADLVESEAQVEVDGSSRSFTVAVFAPGLWAARAHDTVPVT